MELEERSAQRVAVFPARLADDLVLGARAALEAVRGVLGALVVAVRTARKAAAAHGGQGG